MQDSENIARKGSNAKPLAVFFSVFGVPLVGLGALVICLLHPQVSARVSVAEEPMMFLQDPDPRLDKILSAFLRQQAKEVARCRQRAQPVAVLKAVANYNLVARECAPTVFQRTGLPPSLEE